VKWKLGLDEGMTSSILQCTMSLDSLAQSEKIRELKKRLESLNRAPIKRGVEIPPPASRDPMRDLRRHMDRRKTAEA